MTYIIAFLIVLLLSFASYLLVFKKTAAALSKIIDAKGSAKKEDKTVKSDERREKEFSLESLAQEIVDEPKAAKVKRIKLISAFLCFSVTLLILGIQGGWVFALYLLIMGYKFPVMMATQMVNKKRSLFEEQMIDSLGILANSMRTGSSLLQAIEIASKEVQPPLKDVFGEILSQVQLGKAIDKVLWDINKRYKSKDFHVATLSITVSREFGGNLGENLARLSSTMRERRRIQGKIKALTSQARASGMVAAAIPFFVLFVLRVMEPGMYGFVFEHIVGNLLLVIVIGLVSVGHTFMKKLAVIDI